MPRFADHFKLWILFIIMRTESDSSDTCIAHRFTAFAISARLATSRYMRKPTHNPERKGEGGRFRPDVVHVFNLAACRWWIADFHTAFLQYASNVRF